MHPLRFYVPEISPGQCDLPEDQAHHALHVLRVKRGRSMIVFDGHGASAPGTFLPLQGKAFCQLSGPIRYDRPPRVDITIACAVPKVDRAATLIEQASQLGVSRLIWLNCQHSIVRPEAAGAKMKRWRSLAIESAKQCGRNYVLRIDPLTEFSAALEEFQKEKKAILWANPLAPRSLSDWVIKQLYPLLAERTGVPLALLALIGPEGGWSRREQVLLGSMPEAMSVRLTDNILRVETAALTCAAIIAGAIADETGNGHDITAV